MTDARWRKEKWLTCRDCKIRKPINQFARDNTRRIGYKTYCLPCNRIRNRIHNKSYIERNRERANARHRRYLANHPEAVIRHRKNRNPVKEAARAILRSAVYRGKIAKPDKCQKCFKRCIPHGHHKDYSKPLVVVWVCSVCHGLFHKALVQPSGEKEE